MSPPMRGYRANPPKAERELQLQGMQVIQPQLDRVGQAHRRNTWIQITCRVWEPKTRVTGVAAPSIGGVSCLDTCEENGKGEHYHLVNAKLKLLLSTQNLLATKT